MSILSKPYFHDEDAAFEHLEQLLWSEGPVCPHCGTFGRATKLQGSAHRRGVWKCNERECRKQFTVKVGTVFEHGRMPLHKMLQAVHLMASSKKGVSAHQMHRTLEITYKSAWFLAHRIREAMRDGGLAPLGGKGGVIEADETYFGNEEEPPAPIPHSQRKNIFSPKRKPKRGPAGKRAIVSLVERGGRVRSFHPATADGETVAKIVRENIDRETRLHTDESRLYTRVGKELAAHETVTHTAREYVRYEDDGSVTHTNTVEGYFSIFKRGMRGVYQHCSEKHLHRYLAEFDFRYNNRVALGFNDKDRAKSVAKGIVGKRLTYRGTDIG
jgi:transposase-like protein